MGDAYVQLSIDCQKAFQMIPIYTLVALRGRQWLEFSAIFIVVILVGVFCFNFIVVLICISLRTLEAGHLLTCLMAIWASSFVNRLF